MRGAKYYMKRGQTQLLFVKNAKKTGALRGTSRMKRAWATGGGGGGWGEVISKTFYGHTKNFSGDITFLAINEIIFPDIPKFFPDI